MTTEATTTSKWASGLYAPVHEELTAVDLPGDGTLPADLDGRYLRNGPNPIGPVDASYHWFTGDGMVHGVRLRDGRAEWYRNRWVRSTRVSEGLGEDPAPGERFGGFDGANTNAIGHAGRYYAIVEAGARPVELDGELHAMSYWWGRPNVIEYTVVGTDGRVRRCDDIAVPGSPMVHDMSLTAGHVVAYDLPVTFNMEAAAAGTSFPYMWDEDYGARIGVLAREAPVDAIRWFDVDPCYVFHPLNAYDDGDRVV